VGYAVTAVVVYVLGVLTGLVIYTKSRRWCGVCGATLQCADCVRRSSDPGVPQQPTVGGAQGTDRGQR